MKDFLRAHRVLIFFILMFSAFMALYQLFDMPTTEEVIAFIKKYYDQYGYWLVFLGALAEGALLLNWYLPGSLVVVMGVVFSKPDPVKAALIVVLIIVGFFLTTLFNYALGRYGWYRLLLKLGLQKPLDETRAKVESKGLPIVFSTYIHPNLGALTATCAGILRLPFKQFCLYSIGALVAWNTLWGLVAYFAGPQILNYLTTPTIIAALLIYMIYAGIKHWKKNKSGVTTL